MNLQEIYQPIAKEMAMVESFLCSAIRESNNPSVRAKSEFLLESPGKRIRPALLILSEKSGSFNSGGGCDEEELVQIATAMEMIHMASLIHDDVLDRAKFRRNRPSVNARWGNDVSIVLGDYVYSKAFELVGKCRNPEVFTCISEAIYVMCEGELAQVIERSNSEMTKESYLSIIEKKTATLFAACCQTGSLLGNNDGPVRRALHDYGKAFGIAFQIIDDSRDIMSDEDSLGKPPGQDVISGDLTLPLLMLLEVSGPEKREELIESFGSRRDSESVSEIRKMFMNSDAAELTRQKALSYIEIAKENLHVLCESDYRQSLVLLADYVTNGVSQDMLR